MGAVFMGAVFMGTGAVPTGSGAVSTGTGAAPTVTGAITSGTKASPVTITISHIPITMVQVTAILITTVPPTATHIHTNGRTFMLPATLNFHLASRSDPSAMPVS